PRRRERPHAPRSECRHPEPERGPDRGARTPGRERVPQAREREAPDQDGGETAASHIASTPRCAYASNSERPRTTRSTCGVTLAAMPQVVDFPPIGQDQRGALAALVRVCKDMPAKGEPFR